MRFRTIFSFAGYFACLVWLWPGGRPMVWESRQFHLKIITRLGGKIQHLWCRCHTFTDRLTDPGSLLKQVRKKIY
jgi:hypothetical protein